MSYENFMNRCFQLARLGSGKVAPNPLVGSVLVHEGKIISEGYHEYFGGPHAEVNALRSVHDQTILKSSTLYVNLEPCSHTGKTPPCSELIISKGIGHVVISNKDPFPKVNGTGISMLRKAGIKVTAGILQNEGEELNKRFFTFHKKHRPYIILKWAQTPSGWIAPAVVPGKKKTITWISNETSRLMVHKWRSEEQSILVGSNTVKNDNPRLNVRGIEGKNPIRIIIDTDLILKGSFHVLDNSVPTYVINYTNDGENKNTRFLKVRKSKTFIPDLLDRLYFENIQSVLIEGGALTLQAFIDSGYWDEARVFTGTVDFKNGVAAPVFNGIKTATHKVADDTLSLYLNQEQH